MNVASIVTDTFHNNVVAWSRAGGAIAMSMERLMTTMPGDRTGALLSTPAQRVPAYPLCTVQELDREDLQTLCDALTDEERRLQARTDTATFRLHLQFLQAHGLPKGELTTLMTTSSDGGAFLSGAQRHK